MCNPALPLLWVGGRGKKKKNEPIGQRPHPQRKKAVQDRIYAQAAWTLSHSKNSPSLPARSLFPVKLGEPRHTEVTHCTASLPGLESGHNSQADEAGHGYRDSFHSSRPQNAEFLPQKAY